MGTPQRVQQREEAEKMVVGPGAVSTGPQARGWATGIAVGAVVGAILGAIVGLIFYPGAVGILISAVVGAVAGGVFGFVFGGYRGGETRLEEGRPQV
jgi:hypothetical protein